MQQPKNTTYTISAKGYWQWLKHLLQIGRVDLIESYPMDQYVADLEDDPFRTREMEPVDQNNRLIED